MKRDTYKEPITYTYPNAIVRVFIPVLTDEERAARMKQVYAAAADVMKERWKR